MGWQGEENRESPVIPGVVLAEGLLPLALTEAGVLLSTEVGDRHVAGAGRRAWSSAQGAV